MNVGIIAKATKTREAKYFAKMILVSLMGLVTKLSIVPVLFSSAKDLMVTAGISNKKI